MAGAYRKPSRIEGTKSTIQKIPSELLKTLLRQALMLWRQTCISQKTAWWFSLM